MTSEFNEHTVIGFGRCRHGNDRDTCDVCKSAFLDACKKIKTFAKKKLPPGYVCPACGKSYEDEALEWGTSLAAEVRRLQQEIEDLNNHSVYVNAAQLAAEASYQAEIERLQTALANERKRCAEIARGYEAEGDLIDEMARVLKLILDNEDWDNQGHCGGSNCKICNAYSHADDLLKRYNGNSNVATK